MVAKVAVSAAVFAIDRPYSYIVPEALQSDIEVGTRVNVPFGKGNKKCEGIVLALEDDPQRMELKPISSVLDKSPVFTKDDIQLALWMRDRFFCTLYEAARAMLPAGMWFNSNGRRIQDKTQKFIRLAISGEEAGLIADQKRLRAPHQASVLELLSTVGEAAAKDICNFTGATSSVFTSLEKNGLIVSEVREVLRRPKIFSHREQREIIFNDQQRETYEGLNKLLASGKASAALLYGVTGSGKTSIYIKLVHDTIDLGRTAIVLVPEIGLTPQVVEVFSSHFGDEIAVLHSSLTMGERNDEWKRIKSGSVKVVIGTRSAIFAPLENIGLIIIDEEQEHTYKSENVPRYHARDVAKFRCVKSNALLLLGSATPAVESMYYAQNGKYAFFHIDKRYNDQPLPDVIITDMREELRNGNGGIISATLRDEIEKNIQSGEQSILFLNRRGDSNLVVCGECGYTFTCDHCSVSMTYHSVEKKLMCHYCGHTQKLPHECPECGGTLKFIGAGTQKVEAELAVLFPDVEVIRMDTDTVSKTGSHQTLLNKFKNEKIPILLGTQMVTKGLDFENVTLAGVLSADQLLYMSDWRASERAFSLMTQLIGRSGRGSKKGRAVIQTFTPNNQIISLAAAQDYLNFYNGEIGIRNTLQIPPIRDVIAITVTGLDEGAVLRGCMTIENMLKSCVGKTGDLSLYGPAPAGIVKVNNRYRYRLSVCCRNDRAMRDTISSIIRTFVSNKENRGLSVFADADPID